MRRYEPSLTQPGIGVPLDPERTLTATRRPLGQVGTSVAAQHTDDVLASREGQLATGVTLVYDEDTDLMTPAQAMAVRPQPELSSYR